PRHGARDRSGERGRDAGGRHAAPGPPCPPAPGRRPAGALAADRLLRPATGPRPERALPLVAAAARAIHSSWLDAVGTRAQGTRRRGPGDGPGPGPADASGPSRRGAARRGERVEAPARPAAGCAGTDREASRAPSGTGLG